VHSARTEGDEEMAARHGHRRRVTLLRAVAELRVAVRAPAIRPARLSQTAAERVAQIQRDEALSARDERGRRLRTEAAIADLALLIVAPTVRVARGRDSARVPLPCHHRRPAQATRDQRRRRLSPGGRAVAHLSIIVCSPAVQIPVRRYAAGEAIPDCNRSEEQVR